MPTYVYRICKCWDTEEEKTFERNVPIAERDNQPCQYCKQPLERVIAFTGLTWAPTAGGMR